MGNPQYKYRFERKYNLNEIQLFKLKHLILNSSLVEHHPPRWINNLYFDSLSYNSYHENVEGLSDRKKVRIRWYGTQFGAIKPTFEVKIKSEYVNRKESTKLKKIIVQDKTAFDSLKDDALQELMKQESKNYTILSTSYPSLLNRYYREYYISNDRSTRLTIDQSMWFYNFKSKKEHADVNHVVMEIKYKSDSKMGFDVSEFNLQLDKSSKYVLGLDLTA